LSRADVFRPVPHIGSKKLREKSSAPTGRSEVAEANQLSAGLTALAEVVSLAPRQLILPRNEL
jgi:hypothetical protein